jgi:hypothetical protein
MKNLIKKTLILSAIAFATFSGNAQKHYIDSLVITPGASNGKYLKSDATGLASWADAGAEIGDVKTGMQTADHKGWIRLDGRAVSSLTATQQAAAATLGITTNLPNANNAYLAQTGGTLGALSFANTKNIIRGNLPLFTLGGTTNTTGAHTHTLSNGAAGFITTGGANNWLGSAGSFGNAVLNSAGNHSHTVTTENINDTGVQTAFDVRPLTLSVNTFIYLGN